jgi:hypothetical protein
MEYENNWDKNLEGKTISKVFIRTLNVAGESVNETPADSTWINNIANSIHYKTRSWVIRERLLFKAGDKLNYRTLYESERLLRSTNLFLDVKINVFPSAISKDEVEVVVITKDRWTLTYLASYKPGDKSGYLGLKDNNFIGLGHTAEAEITYNNDPSIGLGGKIGYTVSNIKGTYTDFRLNLEANKKYDVKSISLSRPFVTYQTDWIAGFELKWERNTYDTFDQNDKLVSLPLKQSSQDLWGGYAVPVNIANEFKKSNSNLITSLRILSLNHSERPYNPMQYRIFENSTMLLFGVGLVSRDFYKDKLVQQFGITEDIPVGESFSISTGPEKRELSDRWYLGFETAYSNWYDDYGYFSGRIGIGTFRRDNQWEQNTYRLSLLYNTYLYKWKIWRYRLFMNYDLLLGYNRISGELTYLNSSTGLRGFNKSYISGTKRMVLNLEARIFSPYQLLGFVIGGVAFSDFGLIAGSNHGFLSSRFYQGYGAGFRIKNESIINAAFELVGVFNPYNPQNKGAAFSILLSTNFAIGIRQIGYSKPFVEPFYFCLFFIQSCELNFFYL